MYRLGKDSEQFSDYELKFELASLSESLYNRYIQTVVLK